MPQIQPSNRPRNKSTMSASSRRVKCPKNIPVNQFDTTRRSKTKTRNVTGDEHEQPEGIQSGDCNYKGKLERLFGVEREFSRAPVVLATEDGGGWWRVQAEGLRAECDFLKMEREFGLKKLEKKQVRIERRLKSGLKSVASGRKNLCEGKNIEAVLEEEMKELSDKLEELQKCKKECNSEVNGDCLNLTCKSQHKYTDGMLDSMEKDYRSIINRIDFVDYLTFSNRFSNQGKEPMVSQEASNKCSGRCKALVKRMVEQVRAETEQWSQMQEMLGKLRQEMEELQTSKEFWEAQALASNQEIQSLMFTVEQWKKKALKHEKKANRLQTEVDLMKNELEKLKNDQRNEIQSTSNEKIKRETMIGMSFRMKIDKHQSTEQSKKETQPLSLAKQLAMEKRILTSRLKENQPENYESVSDNGNSPSSSSTSTMSIVRQHSNAIFPLHCSRAF